MPAFVKFQMPEDLVEKVYESVELARKTGKVRLGVNETTKSIERGHARFIVMAEDVTPEEILMHLPVICDEKQVAYAYVPSKVELGKVAGINVPTSSVAITEEGDSKKILRMIVERLKSLKQH